VAKLLQTETWLLLTAYKKSPVPYVIAPSPTTYDLPFSHNTSITNDERQKAMVDNHAKDAYSIAVVRQ